MCGRKAELAVKYGISTDRLDLYEEAGILKPISLGGQLLYPDIRVAVIAKAERLGFSLNEIGILVAQIARRSDDDFECTVCHQHGGALVG